MGEKMLRQAKGALKIITHDVHIDYVMLGRIIPSNGLKRISTLNSRAFPQDGYRDQSQAGNFLAQYGPGRMLLLPSKYPAHAQCHPAVVLGQISPDLFPKTVDIERNMLFFDPPCTSNVTVQLTRPQLGLAENVPDGDPALAPIPVRGHNLVPLPRPAAGAAGSWFPIVRTALYTVWRIGGVYNVGDQVTVSDSEGPPGTRVWTCTAENTGEGIAGAPAAGNGPLSVYSGDFWSSPVGGQTLLLTNDKGLLYQYSDFEALWKSPETM